MDIDLFGGFEDVAGTTANEPGDVDTSANGLQNLPVITSARTVSGKTTINAKLASTLSRSFVIQFFSNPSGNEGQKFIGQKAVNTDASGNATFTFKPNKKVAAGRTITVTATRNAFDLPSDTSEFSVPRTVAAT